MTPRKTLAITALAVFMLVLPLATRSFADRDGGQRRNGVNVLEATFGGTTVPIYNGCEEIAPGNVTSIVHAACQGQKTCEFTVELSVLGDPSPGCWKSFEVTYQCAMNPNATQTELIPANPDGADGQTVVLSCPIK